MTQLEDLKISERNKNIKLLVINPARDFRKGLEIMSMNPKKRLHRQQRQ